MQLGVSIGRLFGNKWSNRVNNLFPYLFFLGMIYIFYFLMNSTDLIIEKHVKYVLEQFL